MARFVPSETAREWMARTPVSKKAEIAALVYLKQHGAPDSTIEQLHHLDKHKESFDTRRKWLIDEMNGAPGDIWEESAVNKIVSARLIFMAEEHKRLGLKDDDGVAWHRLIIQAQRKYPQ